MGDDLKRLEIMGNEIDRLTKRLADLENAEQKHREREESYQRFMQAFPHSIVVFQNDKVIHANDAVARLLGYPNAEALLGMDAWAAIPERMRESQKKLMAEQMSADPSQNIIAHSFLITSDGTEIPVDIAGHAISLDGRPALQAIVIDATQRDRARTALIESEEKYRDIIENLNDIVYTIDSNGKITYISPIAKNIFGYETDELLGQDYALLIHPDDLSLVRDSFKDVLNDKIYPSEFRIIRKDGEIRWARTSSRPITDGNTAKGIRGIMIDITERKLVEQACRESEAKYRAVIDNMKDVFFRTSLDGKIIMVSPSAKMTFGVKSIDELIGRNVVDAIYAHPEERAVLLREMEAKGSVPDYELYLKNIEGKIIPMSVNCHFYYDDQGKRLGIEGVLRDISARKKAEAELLESRAKFQALLETTSDFIWEVDAHGKYTYCSPQMERLWGINPQERLGKTPFDMVPAEYKAEAIEFFNKTAMSAQSFAGLEFTSFDGRGNLLNVEISGVPFFDLNGNLAGYRGITRDITERKKAEEILRQKDELNRAMIDNSPLGISIRDPRGKLISYNRAWQSIYGRSDEEMTRIMAHERKKLEFDRGDDYLRPWHSDIRRIYEEGGYLHIPEVRLVYISDDGPHWVSKHFYAIKDERNQVERIVILTEDITHSKRTQDALKKSQERMTAIAEVMPDVLFVLNEDGRYVEVLSSNESLRYAPFKELKNKLMHEVLPREVADNFLDLILKTIDAGQPQSIEYSLDIAGKKAWFDGRTTALKTKIDGKACVVWAARDITDKKMAEEAFRESARRFQELFQNSLNSYVLCEIITDAGGKPVDYRYLEVNRAAEETMGMKAADVNGRLASDIYPGVENPEFIEMMGRIAQTGEPLHFVHHSKATGRIYETASFCPRKGQFASVFFDITERELASKAIRESEERYRSVWENSPVGICLNDRNGIYLYVNPTYCKIYGYREDELIGFSLYDKILPKDHPTQKKRDFYHNFDNPERTTLGETTAFIKKNGESVFVQYSSDFVWEDNKPKFLVSFNVDITEKKRAEMALTQSEEKYRLVIENAIEVISTVDYDGKFGLLNAAAAAAFRAKPSDFMGKTIWDLFPKEFADRMLGNIRNVITSGNALTIDSMLPILGEEKWYRTNIQPIIGSNGKITSALIMATDFTEQKTNEIRDMARLELLQNLRNAKDIDECLTIGCQAIYNARLFKRAVLTLHAQDREITNLGQIGLEESVVKQARNSPPPDMEIAKRITQEKYRISNSFFVPEEDGIMNSPMERRVTQELAPSSREGAWKSGDEFFTPLMSSDNKCEGWLSVDTPFTNKRPRLVTAIGVEEIIDIVSKQVHEIQMLEKLTKERRSLEEKTIVLREVMGHIEDEKMDIRQKIGANVAQILMPAFQKLLKKDGTVSKTYYNILKNGLPELATASGALIHLYTRLSPREREICDMIKNGSSSKEIAETLNIALATVQKHRELIRKKLGIINKDVNLTNFLKGL